MIGNDDAGAYRERRRRRRARGVASVVFLLGLLGVLAVGPFLLSARIGVSVADALETSVLAVGALYLFGMVYLLH